MSNTGVCRAAPGFAIYAQRKVCRAGCRRRPSPAETPPIGKIHHFINMAVIFEPDGTLIPFGI